MSKVECTNPVGRTPVRIPRPTPRPTPTRQKAAPDKDSLAHWVRQVKELPPVRAELVERIKAELAAGTYETPEKVEAAVDRLLEELTGS